LVTRTPPGVNLNISANRPSGLLQALQERCKTGLSLRIVGGCVHQHSDAANATGLLRYCAGEPHSRRRTTEEKEIPPPHARPRAQEAQS